MRAHSLNKFVFENYRKLWNDIIADELGGGDIIAGE